MPLHPSLRLLVIPLLLLANPVFAEGLVQPPAEHTIVINTPQQDWQVRRQRVFELINVINTGGEQKQAALDELDAVLTGYENNPFSITPMEAMDLYRVYYFPKDGLSEENLSALAMMATLGWYDTLRFASASGRAEIIDNEQFFSGVLMSSDALRDEYVQALKERRSWAEAAVEKGISIAESVIRNKDMDRKDKTWPSAYGLERIQCAMQKLEKCPAPQALTEAEWPSAADEAIATAHRYYLPAEK